MSIKHINNPIYIVLAVLVLAGLVYFFINKSDDNQATDENQVVQTQPTVTDEQTEEESTKEESDPTPQKESNQGSTNDQEIEKRPVVATGYGNSPDKPLPEGQQTSTTCTTDAGVECVLVFKSGGQTITFDTKSTNSQGVAVWNWTGGEEVGSGNWEVTATAGDKTSVPGVVYVQ